MPVEMKPSSRYSRFAGEMGFSLEVKSRSRSHETSEAETPKILSSRSNQLLKCREKGEVGSQSGLLYSKLDFGHGSSPRTIDGLKLESPSKVNSEEPCVGIKGNKNELVKHMSDLPGYLQRFEKGESMQEKALNFGVLDWGSLEKWKHKKRISPGSTSAASSSSAKSLFKAKVPSTLSDTVQSKSLTPRRKKPHSVKEPSDVDSYLEQSRREVIPKEPETPKTVTSDRLRNSHWLDRLDGRYNPEKSKRKDSDRKVRATSETLLSGLRKDQLLHPCNAEISAHGVVTPTLVELQAPVIGQRHGTRDHRGTVRTEDSPRKEVQTSIGRMLFDAKSRQEDSEISPEGSCQEAHSAGLTTEVSPSCPLPDGLDNHSVSNRKKPSLIHGRDTGLPDDTHCTSCSSIESPTVLSHNKCMEANSAGMTHLGEKGLNILEQMDNGTTEPAAAKRGLSSPSRRFSFSLEKISRSLSFKESPGKEQLSSVSDCIEPDIFSDCFSSDGHHSEESLSGTIHSCASPVGVETNTSFDMSARSMDFSCSDISTFSCPDETSFTPRSENAIRIRKSLDPDTSERASLHGRHPSPNHRFSFSLGRLTRSFSFKEGLAVPKMNAASVSGPVTLEVSGSLDNENRNKAASQSRARSSPLRRMLDPLLKARVTYPSANSFTEKLNLTSEGMSKTKSHQHKNSDAPIRALLQIRVKNGLPVFELVVKNSREILVAMRKPDKDDADWTYTLYSVSAVKKKSGIWMNHGKKGKSRAFEHTVVGQMKISEPLHPDLVAADNPRDQFTLRESVLYGFDAIQADHETSAFMPTMEGAAIIVKIPTCDDGDQKTENKELMMFRDFFLEDGHYCRSLEIDKFNTTTVVLPGGVHCSPNGELPSPLLERWKSGGSCDCGGWDLGCKLRVLTNDDQTCNFPGQPQSFSSQNGFHLYCQGGSFNSRPIFSLTPFEKGIYSVEFQKPVSLVQAFSICVAVISSHQSFDFSEENDDNRPADNHQEAILAGGRDRMRFPARFHGEMPPPSPVGRV